MTKIVDWLVRTYYIAAIFLMLIPILVFMTTLALADEVDKWLGYGRD
jgi:hypothetical protein